MNNSNFKVYKLGSGRDCDLRINDPAKSVSKYHAKIIFNNILGEDPKLIDNSSTNGSFIFRKDRFYRIQDCFIRHDDTFRLGKYQITGADILKKMGTKQKKQGINKKRARHKYKPRQRPVIINNTINSRHNNTYDAFLKLLDKKPFFVIIILFLFVMLFIGFVILKFGM